MRTITVLLIASIFLVSFIIPSQSGRAASTITFTGEELLGIPRDDSITINIIPAAAIEYHYQYGTSPGVYGWQTDNQTAAAGQPSEIELTGLSSDTRYYYRMQYHAPGDAMDDWVDRDEHTFHTQRAPGSSFTFSITSDSHAQFNSNHQNTMTNILNELPDFNLDLGDTFYSGNAGSQAAVNNAYLAYREPLYMDKIGASVPIFLAAGNHEDEEGWNIDDTPFSPAVGSIQARKAFFPTPIDDGPGGFYSGNTDPLALIDELTYGDQYREDYYAWTWGDALFVVIDEFQYTMQNPYGSVAGEGFDDPATGDQWNWTLGAEQYQWFKQTLENSTAKYKFVFSHNMLGGIPRDISVNPAGYVRGGAEAAAYFEWGGLNADDSYGYSAHRDPAEFGTVPIHQLMIANGVSAYFHGHDHQYVYEIRDGIVYQEMPSPSMSGSGFSGIYSEGDHGTYETIDMLPNSGHLLVTVTPTGALVEYISSSNTSGTVNTSYSIAPNTNRSTYALSTAVSPAGGGTLSPAEGVYDFTSGSTVDVFPLPEPGYLFDHWSGDCSGSDACTVTMDGNRSVTAVFQEAALLTVIDSGTGAGSVTASLDGIDCGIDCSETYPLGSSVTLTAVPSDNYNRFLGWSGSGISCPGTDPCSVTLDADLVVTAEFEASTFGDVPFDHQHWAYIQALYDNGLTAGCSADPLLYCPDANLTRAEAAVFMLRGRLGTTYEPPTDQAGYVFDNDDWSSSAISWGRIWAEGLWDEGMTAGCNDDPLMFCPGNLLPRVEGAVFGLRIKYGTDYVLPDVQHIFDASEWESSAVSWGEAWAEQAYQEGLLPECSTVPLMFCPDVLMTRSWAAYLIVNAKELALPEP